MSGDGVTGQHEAVRRALSALEPERGDVHPGHGALEAYVEGRLTPEQRAEIDRLAAQSRTVAEDLADLQAVHQTLTAAPMARRDVRWNRIAAVAGVAAAIIAAVWISMPTRVQAPTRRSSLVGEEAARVQQVIDAGRINVPQQLSALRPAPGTLLGRPEPATFTLQSPVGTLVSSTTPVFTWDDASAESYTVAVFDQNFSELAHADVKGTTWQPAVELPRGTTLSWQVTAHRGSVNDTEPKPPRPEARFSIVDAATADAVALMQSRLVVNDPLPLGILLAERGLIAEAKVHLRNAAANPATADIAKRLLESLDQGTPTTTKPAQ